MAHKVEISLPVLNEEATLERQVTLLRTFLDSTIPGGEAVSIVIADNGSTDDTLEIAMKLQDRVPLTRVVNVGKRGVGLALKESWASSAAEVVGYMDLDFSTDLRHIQSALAPLLKGDAHVVAGSRLAEGAVVMGRSLRREVASRSFNALVAAALGTHFTDGMCGFKFLRREVLPQLSCWGATSDGWFYATQLLVAAERSGLIIREVPVNWTDDSDSKVNIPRLAVEYIQEIWALRQFLNHRSPSE